ncbi:MAG: sulfurtransferase [Chloroflexota bacterium]
MPSTPDLAASHLVSTEWLAAHLDDPNVRVVDCRHYFDGRVGREEYEKGHLPGAVHLDWSNQLADKADPIAFKVAKAPRVKQVMEAAGIGDDTIIVGYDDEGGHFVSRLWLVLAVHGHGEQVRLLDGGLTRWEMEGRPLTTAAPAARVTTFTPRGTNAGLLATADDVLAATKDPSVVIVDVRRRTEYNGEELRAARGGRIPNVRWLFWQDLLNWSGDRSHRSADEILARAREVGLNKDQPIITYCQGGVRAAHTALTLMANGFTHVRVYDGSWEEWGNREDLPIEVGEPG